MDSFVNRSCSIGRRSIDAWGKIDSISSKFSNKYDKSRNRQETNENFDKFNLRNEVHHKNIDHPYFRNNRRKKIKIFNINSQITKNDENQRIQKTNDEFVKEECTKEAKTNKREEFSLSIRDLRRDQAELIRKSQVFQAFATRSPSSSVQKEQIDVNTNSQFIHSVKFDQFNAKPRIFNGGGNYKKFEIAENNSWDLMQSEQISQNNSNHYNSIKHESINSPIRWQTNHNSNRKSESWNYEQIVLSSKNNFQLPILSRTENNKDLNSSNNSPKRLPPYFSTMNKISRIANNSIDQTKVEKLADKIKSYKDFSDLKTKKKKSKKMRRSKISFLIQKYTLKEWNDSARFAPIISSGK